MKENIAKMKKDIKSLVTEQIVTKTNRKTVKFTGERKMEPWEATYKVQSNKDLLRQYYQAYAILRYKDPSVHELQDEENVQRLYDKDSVKKLLEKYKYEEVVCVDTE